MLVYLLQVLFAAIRTVSRSALNIMLYSFLSRIFKLFGFNTLITFFCSAYCLSKVTNSFQRLWLNARLNNKKPEEKITLNELTWESPTTIIMNEGTDNQDKFETDWKYLLDDDAKNMFPSIVDIPFKNGWLFFATLYAIDYQMNSLNYSYTMSVIRTIGFLIILICGASVRYQTLFEREKNKYFDFMIKNRDEIERYIVYSKNNTKPVASICLQRINESETIILYMVQLFQLNSKFNDYIYDIENYICQKLFEQIKTSADENKKSFRIIWSIPTCKQNWKFAITANKFILRNTYKDFSFMPLVNSYIEQYEYAYDYKDLLSSENIIDDKIKNE
ncbi:unnamed protein product [Adineta steineri]|uniref:Uncharacterized protein n=1 Tax=Adineta steineri TaxID=433720 RepID=A0A818NTC6_9BILA|nr:unnamed protein product [Adineta steineri]CAF3612717.1 unnamed protein product [Adineta steineri]